MRLGILLIPALALGGCGAEDQQVSPPPAVGGAHPVQLDPLAPAAPEPGLGGEKGTHPLFGAGSYSGVDTDEPCNVAQIWKVDTAMELETGTLVVHDGKLWELTGESNEAWAMEACTPPGDGWCADQYQWQEVKACP